MKPDKKKHLFCDVLTVVLLLAALLLVIRLWPLLLLLLVALITYALWILFQTARQPVKDAPVPPPMLPAPVSEEAVLAAAFSLLQRRITEQVMTRYPNVRWVWDVPDAFARFTAGQELTILLNGAGGYRKGAVQVKDLRFVGLTYVTAANTSPDPGQLCSAVPEQEIGATEPKTIDYGLLAFEWVEANLQRLHTLGSEAAAAGRDEFFIPSEELPHGDGWLTLCVELARNGFFAARPMADGIHIKIEADGSVMNK